MAVAVSALGGGAYLGGVFDGGEYYPMAPSDVEARLAGLNFGPELNGAGGGSVNLVLRSKGPKMLRWDMMMSGRKTAEVKANLDPDNTGTRVSVEFQFTDSEATMGLENDPFLNDVAKIAMTEKIDSTLDGRAFNADIVRSKMATMVAANPGAVAEMQKNMHKNVANELDEIRAGGYSGSAQSGGWGSSSGSYRSGDDGGWGKKVP